MKADTTILPYRESSALVTGGIYMVTRNPMYVGMVLVLIGVGLLVGKLLPFFLVPVFFLIIPN